MVRQADTEKTAIKEEGFDAYRALGRGGIACHTGPRGEAKGENGAVSPAKKKMENKVPKEAAAQGAREGPKAKVPASPEGVASKMEPVPLARKAEAPKGLRRPGIPTKSSSSKVATRKAEAES